MKKFVLLLTALCLLAGCTSPPAGISSMALAAPEAQADISPSPQRTQPLNTAVPPPAASSAVTPEPKPTPTPGATPQPYGTLRELVSDTYTIWVDGKELQGLVVNETVLVHAAELSECWPWLQWEGRETSWRYTGEYAEDIKIDCCDLEHFTGTEGIRFWGTAGEEFWLPVSWVAEQFYPWILWDLEMGCVYLTAIPWIGGKALHGHTLPVLMYHEVADTTWGIESLFVKTDNMRAQLQYLYDNGYEPIFFSDISHIDDYEKPVLLTFDDGYAGNYTNLFPLLKEFNMKATVFVITGMLGDENYLTEEQVKEMSDSGLVDIQSHTVDHYELATLSAEDQEYQLGQSQLEIARITKKIPYVISYPSGSYNDTTVNIGHKYYTFGIKMNGGKWTIAGDYFYVDRLYVARSTTLDSFASLLS